MACCISFSWALLVSFAVPWCHVMDDGSLPYATQDHICSEKFTAKPRQRKRSLWFLNDFDHTFHSCYALVSPFIEQQKTTSFKEHSLRTSFHMLEA